MGAREFDRVNDWESRPFEGRDDLRGLADREFSGAVRANGTWVFLLNGRVVGEFGGTVDGVADASGTAYTAPHPGLPLLLTMQEGEGETRAQYYTNDTPLAEVDDTLTSSNFSGYVELSENVLSGDYYVIYYGGRSMSVAFIGEREELITGEEAFERADDEVGIFEVVAANIEVKEVPAAEPDRESRDPGGATTADIDDTPDPSTADIDDTPDPSTADIDDTPDPSTDPATTDEPPDTGAESGNAGGSPTDIRLSSSEGIGTEDPASRSPRDAATPDDGPATGDDAATPGDEPIAEEDKFSREEEWRETTAIPALDPEETRPDDASGAAEGGRAEESPTDTGETPSTEAATEDEAGSTSADSEETDRVRQLRTALEERTAELETLRDRVDELAGTRDELREERDRLADRVGELETELETARATGDVVETDAAGRSLDPGEAIAGTNLFVQYASRGEPTLADAHEDADPETVSENLRIKHHHTQLDPEEVSVEGRPFEEFLEGTPEYRFVDWVLRELPYEIRETGHESDLGDLYDALPEIDRIELHGSVDLPGEGDDEGGSWPFDVIFRDNTGTVLLVADVNDTRTEVERETVERLVTAADDIAETSGLAAAFCLAASLFTDRAHDAVEEATGGSLLSRNTQESFVQTSRKTGYHLCLVRYPEGSFDLVSPKL